MQTTPTRGANPRAPRWALLAAGAAPVALVAGWTVAASRQPVGYDPVRDTISSLAAQGATDRWIMTSALFALGASYVVTGLGLRIAPAGGRVLLVGGGVGTILVGAFPQPVRGNSVAHTVAATVAFIALAAWPVLAVRPHAGLPLMSAPAAASAVAAMFGLLVWFTLELHGSHRGLAERAAALSEAAWPLAVLVGAHRAARLRRRRDGTTTCSAVAA